MSGPPLADLTFSLVGAGKVGRSLAAWLEAAGARAVTLAGRSAVATLSTAGEDLLLLTVPDAALPAVAAALAGRPQAPVVLHTAGGLAAEALAPLRHAGEGAGGRGEGGSAIGTFHPLKAFPRPLLDPTESRGVFFALDGDAAAISLGERLAGALGGEAAAVSAPARPLYHLAASLAAGGVTTLLAAAADLAGRLDLPPAVARGYLELARGAVAAAIAEGDAAAALTGPVARGDAATLERHLAALAGAAPEKLPLARALARETLRQVERRSPLDAAQRKLAEILDAGGW